MNEEKIFRKIKGAIKIIQACLISDFFRQLVLENIKEVLNSKHLSGVNLKISQISEYFLFLLKMGF